MPDTFQRIFSKEDFRNACDEMIQNLPNGIVDIDAGPEGILMLAIPLAGDEQESVEVTVRYQYDSGTYSVEESQNSPGIFKDIDTLDETTIPEALGKFVDGNDSDGEYVAQSSVISSVATANDVPMLGDNEIVYVFGSDPEDAVRYLPPMSATAFAELLSHDESYAATPFTANIQQEASAESPTLEQFAVVRTDDGDVMFRNDARGDMTPSELDDVFNASDGRGLIFVSSDTDNHDILTDYRLPSVSDESMRNFLGIANDEPGSGTTGDEPKQDDSPAGNTSDVFQRSFSKEDFSKIFDDAVQKLQNGKTESDTVGTMTVSMPTKDDVSNPVEVTVQYHYDSDTFSVNEGMNSPGIFDAVDTLDNRTIPETLTKFANDNVDSEKITVSTSVLDSVTTPNDVIPQIGDSGITVSTTQDDQTSTRHCLPPMSADSFASLYEKSDYSNGFAYIAQPGQENAAEQFEVVKNQDGSIDFHNDTEGTIPPSKLDEIFAKINEAVPEGSDKYSLSFSCENQDGETVSTDERLPRIADSEVREYLGITNDGKGSGIDNEPIDFDKEMADRKADYDSRITDLDKMLAGKGAVRSTLKENLG